ncbi:AFR530Wp [Eremothecium gossypii ATCC 10895]|uniref:Mannan endo-1,6-alpha-mannosidase n=1 Tax=Eremothecium gossypii (strain ATCC 10895 / CBS 109.51 / FGSC 9923 / NRRL Y-1056) TaxID=284811 RepID=Q752P3_EREGS|nr:AFR530Wp [Eremothecium gossypii ATCC 10895]AAS53901.2 AFR530Wp [Eremothecium gossypii ATCC 10895]AEY98214.1 FAFR530Wp [Eremothecium gossypii FDAG1]
MTGLLVGLFLLMQGMLSRALDLDLSSREDVCHFTNEIQKGIMDYYWGSKYGGIVGMFQPPYYWWEAGEVFGGMLENWYLCDNQEYESVLRESMIAQTGDKFDYIPANQSTTEGNDDQGVWALFIMGAVERNFKDPEKEGMPGWLTMVQTVFNKMEARWDAENCGGGLRWQIFQWNNGYTYKNTIANGCLFQLAARLGRYTGNQTYLDVASKVFQWLVDVKYIVLEDKARVFDGAHIHENCSDIKGIEWSYNHGIILAGAAYMYNATGGSPEWESHVTKILAGAADFYFRDKIMYERACQDYNTCDNDQRSFKSIFSRMLAITSVVAPFTRGTIDELIYASATAASKSCEQGTHGYTCGLNWHKGTYDGVYGLGEQASALEIIQNVLIHTKAPPLTADTGGQSEGNPDAGLDHDSQPAILRGMHNITGKDRVGASLITAISLGLMLGCALWMIF